MDRHSRSIRGRGQTNDNDGYGSSARGRGQSYDEGYDSYAVDDASYNGESHSARDGYHSGRREHRGTVGSSRARGLSMRDEDSDSDVFPLTSRRTIGATYGSSFSGHPGESEEAPRRYEERMRGDRPRGGEEATKRYQARARSFEPSRHGRTNSETILNDDFTSDGESEYESHGPRRSPGMATSSAFGRERGRGTDPGSSYDSRGPRDHVRGPRRTGDRIDFDDDSEIDSTYDVSYRERRRF